MGKKCPPQAFVGIPAGKFFRRGDGDGEPKPDGEFPVAISTTDKHSRPRPSSTRPSPIIDTRPVATPLPGARGGAPDPRGPRTSRPHCAASTPVRFPRTRARTHESARSFPTLPPSLARPARRLSLLSAGNSRSRLPSHSDSNYPVPDQRYPTAAKSPSASRLPRSTALLANCLGCYCTTHFGGGAATLLPEFHPSSRGGRALPLPLPLPARVLGDSGAWARICVCLPPDPPEARGA